MSFAARARIEEISGRHDALDALAARLCGDLVRPGDAGYDSARRVHNAAIDRCPIAIARPAHAADVVAAVNVAREYGLRVAVRSGGHGEYGSADGALVIDLSRLKGIEIDPLRRTARIEPGLTWNEVAAQTHPYGLALTSGDMGSVGVGGLTTGGGIGWMARKHGLTIDNLLAVEVVTADGRLLRASADEHADLFWGLRGGGGNFGIATAFEFRLHPAGIIYGGAVIYDATEAYEILRAYRDYAMQAPDELTSTAMLMHAPPAPFIPPSSHGASVVAITLCYTGDLAEGERVVAPLRALGTPVADVIGAMPYPALFAMTAEGGKPGRHGDVRSMFMRDLGDEALRTFVDQAGAATAPMAISQLRVLGGAMSRVPEDATAFAHRDKPFMVTAVNVWEDAADSARYRPWSIGFLAALQPFACGVYVNFLGDEGADRVRAAYTPTTYARLAALKERYDPTNLFRLNQNIAPDGPSDSEESAA